MHIIILLILFCSQSNNIIGASNSSNYKTDTSMIWYDSFGYPNLMVSAVDPETSRSAIIIPESDTSKKSTDMRMIQGSLQYDGDAPVMRLEKPSAVHGCQNLEEVFLEGMKKEFGQRLKDCRYDPEHPTELTKENTEVEVFRKLRPSDNASHEERCVFQNALDRCLLTAAGMAMRETDDCSIKRYIIAKCTLEGADIPKVQSQIKPAPYASHKHRPLVPEATKKKDLPLLKILLSHNADVDERGFYNESALTLASTVPLAAELTEHGAFTEELKDEMLYLVVGDEDYVPELITFYRKLGSSPAAKALGTERNSLQNLVRFPQKHMSAKAKLLLKGLSPEEIRELIHKKLYDRSVYDSIAKERSEKFEMLNKPGNWLTDTARVEYGQIVDYYNELELTLKQIEGALGNCPICFNLIQQPKITYCKHIFCEECINEWIQNKKDNCPTCRKEKPFCKPVPQEEPEEKMKPIDHSLDLELPLGGWWGYQAFIHGHGLDT